MRSTACNLRFSLADRDRPSKLRSPPALYFSGRADARLAAYVVFWNLLPVSKGSPLDYLAEVNLTDLRGLALARKRCCAGSPNWNRPRRTARRARGIDIHFQHLGDHKRPDVNVKFVWINGRAAFNSD